MNVDLKRFSDKEILEAIVLTDKYSDILNKYTKQILDNFEDFEWTDTNSGEKNQMFDEEYGKFIEEMRKKYLK